MKKSLVKRILFSIFPAVIWLSMNGVMLWSGIIYKRSLEYCATSWQGWIWPLISAVSLSIIYTIICGKWIVGAWKDS